MNLKKIKIIKFILIFMLCFPLHYIYELMPNTFTSIFFPVNESIWEHMKILFGALLIGGLIEYGLATYFKIKINHLIFNTFIGALLSIPLYLLIYMPLYYTGYESMFLNITLMAIVIVITISIEYYLNKIELPKFIEIISLIGIILTYTLFAYLTYYPIRNDLFYDAKEEKYGLSIYSEKIIKRTEQYSVPIYIKR